MQQGKDQNVDKANTEMQTKHVTNNVTLKLQQSDGEPRI